MSTGFRHFVPGESERDFQPRSRRAGHAARLKTSLTFIRTLQHHAERDDYFFAGLAEQSCTCLVNRHTSVQIREPAPFCELYGAGIARRAVSTFGSPTGRACRDRLENGSIAE
jgi:hypothetical protein